MRTVRRHSLLIALLLSSPAAQASGPIVALFEMEDRGTRLDGEVLVNLIDYLAARLTEGGYQVVPLDQVRERIHEVKVSSAAACYDQHCQIELGRELAAQKTLATKILRIGKSCQVTAVLYDLRRATTETAATEEATCEVDPLLEAIKKIAARLCAPLAKAEQRGDDELAEFEGMARKAADEKAEKKRMETAWGIVTAISQDEQMHPAKRIEALSKFLARFPGDGPRQAEARELLGRLQRSALRIKTQPPGAAVAIGGTEAGRAPLAQELAPGRYTITAALAGHRQARVEVTVEPEREAEVLLSLEPIPSPPPAVAVAQTSSAPEQRERPLRLLGHVGLWSGLACLALGGASLGIGLKYSSDYEGGDLSAEDQARSWTGVMWASFSLGAALAATGAALWLFDEDSPGTGVALVPAESGAALSFAGRW